MPEGRRRPARGGRGELVPSSIGLGSHGGGGPKKARHDRDRVCGLCGRCLRPPCAQCLCRERWIAVSMPPPAAGLVWCGPRAPQTPLGREAPRDHHPPPLDPHAVQALREVGLHPGGCGSGAKRQDSAAAAPSGFRWAPAPHHHPALGAVEWRSGVCAGVPSWAMVRRGRVPTEAVFRSD